MILAWTGQPPGAMQTPNLPGVPFGKAVVRWALYHKVALKFEMPHTAYAMHSIPDTPSEAPTDGGEETIGNPVEAGI
jgi:hypothetical protein